MLRSPAGRLFVARAEEAQPTFALSEANAGPVAEIVRRLEGLPLAMELAAARMRLLSPQALLARLTDRLGFLAGGAQDLPARQQTMRSVIDWSYALLSPAEQALLAQLAVFVGGFTLEAVEAVSADGGADPLAALDALVTNSLVYGGASTGAGSGAATAARFRLLETIREYAAERLAERGEEEAIRERHATYYAELASRPRPYFFSSESEVWLDFTQAEVGNLRAALEWSQAPPERQPRAWQMTADLAWFWYRRGYLDEARRWCERAVAQTASHEGTLARAMALHSAGLVAMWQSDLPTARRLMDEGLATFAGLEEPAARAVALFGRGVLAVNQGETEDAVRFLEEALDVFQGPGADWFRAITLLHLGNAALERGDLGAAQGYHDRCLALSRSVGDRWLVASGVNNLGELARYRGEHSRAEGYYLESRDLFREVGSPPDVARETHSLAWVSLARGDAEEAAALFGEALALHQQAGVQRGVAECLLGFAAIHARAGRARKALSLAAHGRARLEGLGACIWPADALDLERSLEPARVALGEAATGQAEAEGRALDPAEALSLAREASPAQGADALSAP